MDLRGRLRGLSIGEAMSKKMLGNMSEGRANEAVHLRQGERVGTGGGAILMLGIYLLSGRVPNPNEFGVWTTALGNSIYGVLSSLRGRSCRVKH